MLNKQRVMTWTVDTLHEAAWAPFTVLSFYALGLTFRLFKLFPPLDIPVLSKTALACPSQSLP